MEQIVSEKDEYQKERNTTEESVRNSTGASSESTIIEVGGKEKDAFLIKVENVGQPIGSSTNVQGVSLAWRDLSYTITKPNKEKQKIVDNVSGLVRPGEVMAIMGPSGAGKSTLLDLLAGRKDPKLVSGQILLNGRPGYVKYVSTYVMQDDALMAQERRNRVETIIQEFGLSRVADSRIGTIFLRGVSGGEKRRASIASQVITVPKIIFLDEPTTGLDSAASYNVMSAIISMARKHKLTVIASIHQPSTETYSLFDKLFLIGRGRTLYTGSREGAIPYFESLGHVCPPYSNPADHFLYLINSDFMVDKMEANTHMTKFIEGFETSQVNAQLQQEINDLVQTHKLDDDTREISGDTTQRYARNFLAQTWIISVRCFKNSTRNVLVFWVRVAMYVALALLMGSTFWKVGFGQDQIQERFSSQYFGVAFLSFMSVAGIPAFLEERNVFQRERANGFYSVAPYVLANTIISFPFIFIIALSFTLVAYPTIGYNSGFSHAVIFVLFLFLVLSVAESLAVCISALIPIFVAALAITAFANGFFMIFAGYLARPDEIPNGWIWAHYICYQKYAFEAIILNDFRDLKFDCEKLSKNNGTKLYNCVFGDKSGNSAQFSGRDVLEELGYPNAHLWLWALILIGMMVVYRMIFYFILRIRRGRQ
ncbi:hypothetical protein G9A89_019170 [Geosiphon pyriformis]|nr:hypothetical protein G9A89_019170 [Geosiphon pyriformis]